MSIVIELTTDAGSLFQWSTTLTLKYDLRAIKLDFCTFYFIPLPLVTDALFISKSTSRLILSNLFDILKTSIKSPLILRLWRVNKSNYFNRSSYDKYTQWRNKFCRSSLYSFQQVLVFNVVCDQNCIAYSRCGLTNAI